MTRSIQGLMVFVLTFLLGTFISPSVPAGWVQPVDIQSPISEITLKRHGCYGSCPVYEVTLRSDGTADYTGYMYVDRIGSYHAENYQFLFNRVAPWLDQQGFFEFADEYERGWVDAEVVTTIATRQSHRKSVTTYNSPDPAKLWAIHSVIDGVVSQIHWKRTGFLKSGSFDEKLKEKASQSQSNHSNKVVSGLGRAVHLRSS